MDCSPLCWCGFHFKGAEPGEYQCIDKSPEALEKQPWLRDAMAHTGFNPDSPCEIGVVSRIAAKTSEERWFRENP